MSTRRPFHCCPIEEEIEQKINRSFEAVGRKLSPTYIEGRAVTHNKAEEFNERSAECLARINAKYRHKTSIPIVRTVDADLHVHGSRNL